jgi:hypothetical protein
MKKLMLILIPLLIIGGVVGAAFMGLINIPGITPKKADWKADLVKIFKAKGSIKGDLVVLKDPTKEETAAFTAAAKAGALDPVSDKKGIKSAKLVEFLKKETAAPPAKKVAAKPVETKTPPTKPPVVVKPGPTIKPEQGAQTIADLWNAIEVPKLVTITEKYKDPELATILLKMDADHASEFLSALPAPRAASLSRELQKQGSIVPTPTPAGA